MLICPLFFSFFLTSFVESVDQKPNILFIVADDLGWNDVSFHGSQQIPTPNIDRLAREGTILNNYYVLPLCTPSRAALLTGRYPIRYGLQHSAIGAAQRSGLPLHEKIIPQYLNQLNYTSHALGKWQLGFFNERYTPTFRGFETFYGHYSGKTDYFTHQNEDGSDGWIGLDWHFDVNGELSSVPEDFGQYSTHLLTSRACSLISGHDYSQSPLFLYVAYNAVHTANPGDPLQAPTETVLQFHHIWNTGRRKFAAMVTELDRGVGEIVGALEATGKRENTFILFTTDNGGPTNGFDENWANNWPLRAGKGYFYEGGIRGTAFVNFPAQFGARAGQVSTDLIHICDWLPTVVEAAGGDVETLNGLDGMSMFGTLAGERSSPRHEFLVNVNPSANSAGVRMGKFKLLKNPEDKFSEGHDDWFEAPGRSAHINATIKPHSTPSQVNCGPVPYELNMNCHSRVRSQHLCLYDIENDPCEFHNLVDDDEYQEVLKKLLALMRLYEEEQVPYINPHMDPQASPSLHNNTWVPWTDSIVIPKH